MKGGAFPAKRALGVGPQGRAFPYNQLIIVEYPPPPPQHIIFLVLSCSTPLT